jgi:hypothetical protein
VCGRRPVNQIDQRADVHTPFGQRKMGVPVAADQRAKFFDPDLARLAPEQRLTVGTESDHIRLKAVSDRNLDRQVGVVRQIQRPQQGFHHNMSAVFFGMFDKHDLFAVRLKRPFTA